MDSDACVWAGASAGHAGEMGWADGARVGPAGRPAGPACWAHAGVGKGRVGLLLGWVLVVGLGLGWVEGLGFLFPTLLLSKSNSNKV